MEETQPVRLTFNIIFNRGIIVEFLEENPYTLTSVELPLSGYDLKYATLTSEHLPVASGLFRWFRSAISHCNSENGSGLVNEMIEVFRYHKDELPIHLREYILYDGIVGVCFREHIDDSLLIKRVLDLLHENWHFGAILVPSFILDSFGIPTKNSKQIDFLTFYLEHIRRIKLDYNGSRFIDESVYSRRFDKAPAFIAADVWRWKPLLRYLQFGARFENVTVDPTNTRNGVHSALTETLRNMIRHLWFRLVRPTRDLVLTDPKVIQEYCSNLSPVVRDVCHTLKIILRCIKRLENGALEFVFQDFSEDEILEVSSDTVINHPTVHLLLPTLSQRYKCPMQLQHACRWTIRNRLNENWQLPVGINQLPIPKLLKKYLNLLKD